MAFNPEDVIDAAREEDGRFSPEMVPDAAVVPFLNRKQKRVRERTFEIATEILLAEETISFPLTNFSDGYTFQNAWDQIYGGTIHFSGHAEATIPLELIPYKQRNRPPTSWPAYVKGDKLYFVGSKADWNSVDKVVVDYVPAIVEISSKTTDFQLPDRAKPVMVAFAKEYMARRHEEIDPAEVQQFKSDRQEDEGDYYAWLSSRTSRAETATWREVW